MAQPVRAAPLTLPECESLILFETWAVENLAVPKLERLTLHAPLTGAWPPRLRTLALSGVSIQPDDIRALVGLPLESLALLSTAIGEQHEDAVGALSAVSSLRKLFLDENRLTGIDDLPPGLEELSLRRNH